MGLGRRRLQVIALAVGLSVGTGLAASAYWATAGTGSGAAATGSAAAVTLTPGVPSADLSPGGQATVVLQITNPNDAAVLVGSLGLETGQGAAGFAVDAGHPGCGLATLSLSTQTNDDAGWTVPARVGGADGELDVALTDAVAMSLDADDACQGAGFVVYLVAGP